jgi:hypothetical protein
MRRSLEISPRKHITIYSEDDVSDVLENNKKLRGMSQTGDFRHVASIPPVVLVKWLDEERNRGRDIKFLSKEMDELVAQKLRDPDWAFLRTDGPQHRVGWGK